MFLQIFVVAIVLLVKPSIKQRTIKKILKQKAKFVGFWRVACQFQLYARYLVVVLDKYDDDDDDANVTNNKKM